MSARLEKHPLAMVVEMPTLSPGEQGADRSGAERTLRIAKIRLNLSSSI
jgi:hypothetical protein